MLPAQLSRRAAEFSYRHRRPFTRARLSHARSTRTGSNGAFQRSSSDESPPLIVQRGGRR